MPDHIPERIIPQTVTRPWHCGPCFAHQDFFIFAAEQRCNLAIKLGVVNIDCCLTCLGYFSGLTSSAQSRPALPERERRGVG